jgi:methionyl-tRNA synthetase
MALEFGHGIRSTNTDEKHNVNVWTRAALAYISAQADILACFSTNGLRHLASV